MNKYLQRARHAYKRAREFVTVDIWEIGSPGEELRHGLLVKQLRVGILLLQGMAEEMLLLRAAALTFASLLCIVPFLVFMFFIIQSFNLADDIYSTLSTRVDQQLESIVEMMYAEGTVEGEPIAEGEVEGAPAPTPAAAHEGEAPVEAAATTPPGPTEVDTSARKTELRNELVGMLFQGWDQHAEGSEGEAFTDPVKMLVEMAEDAATDKQTLGITGILFVLTTIFGLMRNIEWSFNKIWGVKETRNVFRSTRDYLLVTILLPFVASAVLGMTAGLAALDTIGVFPHVLRGAQFVVICLTFAMLYKWIPNTRVDLPYAMLAGLVAGVAWTMISWGYISFNVGLARYELFFSTFALFPLFLMWLYTSWVVFLFGALLTFAYQNEKTFAMERYADQASIAYREALAVRTMVEMTRQFRADGRPLDVTDASQAWNVPSRLLHEILDTLVAAGLVTECATEPVTFQPGRAPDTTRLRDVLNAIRAAGQEPSSLRNDEAYAGVYRELDTGGEIYLDSSLAEMAQQIDSLAHARA